MTATRATDPLSPPERDFYDALYARAKAEFAGLVASRRVLNKYAAILTLLLRLRQSCDHPYLVFASTASASKTSATGVIASTIVLSPGSA